MTPDVAVLVFTAGAGLIFFELNRPGLVVPGAVGLLGVLLAVAAWVHTDANPFAFVFLLMGAAVACYRLRRPVHVAWEVLAIVCWTLGFRFVVLTQSTPFVLWWTAVPCGILLGTASSVLGRIAYRARRNKGVN